MRNKILGLLAIVIVIAMLPTSAFAAGPATITNGPGGIDGDALSSNNDDGNALNPRNTSVGRVEASVIEGDRQLVVYVDIHWGHMKFSFSNGNRRWCTDTHRYIVSPGGDGLPKWLINNGEARADGIATESYLDGINNRIKVINRSNTAMDFYGDFDFTVTQNRFNDSPNDTEDINVRGGFYSSNDAARLGARLINNEPQLASDRYRTPTGGFNTRFNNLSDTNSGTEGRTQTLTLHTAEGRDPNVTVRDTSPPAGDVDPTNTWNVHDIYFAFSGTPDSGKSEGTLANFVD